MPIELDSAGWTGGDDAKPTAVCGEFRDRAALDSALSRLEGSLFQRADLSVRGPGERHASNAVRDDDARNLRTLGTSTASAGAAIAAAGVVIATGGAALPAIAAAAAVGGATAAAGTAVGVAATPDDPAEPTAGAPDEAAVLVVNAAGAEKVAKAEELLREAGAMRVWHDTKE